MNWNTFFTPESPKTESLPGLSDPLFYRAAQLFHMATGGSCRFSDISGDSALNARRDIMTALRGKQATVAQSGLNAVRKALLSLSGVDSKKHCPAECESVLRNAIRSKFN